jgi:hypothetical protein
MAGFQGDCSHYAKIVGAPHVPLRFVTWAYREEISYGHVLQINKCEISAQNDQQQLWNVTILSTVPRSTWREQVSTSGTG